MAMELTIPIEVQQFIDNLHTNYAGVIQKLTQENAFLQAQLDNALTINAELKAENDALQD